MNTVVVLGAGHAGGSVAALLRRYGFAGRVVVVGDEPLPPYQRPPLSKAWLKGEVDAEALALRPLEFYAENQLELLLDRSAERIDRAAKQVLLSDGSWLSYDTLILATGARAMILPIRGADLGGVYSLRSAADAEAIKAELGPGKTIAVIGAGYIGLEVAASARALGAEAVVFEKSERILGRVACEPVATFLQAYHADRGVSFKLGVTVTALVADAAGSIAGVQLDDGAVIACDAAVIGIGAVPNVALAYEAGLACENGVVVDLDAHSITDPDIFAIGDVAQRPNPIYGRQMRLESVPNALEQAKQAAAAITGKPRPPGECPWQWSDQYDLKLQIAGYPVEVDELLVRGDANSASFSVFHMKGDVVQCVEAVNAANDFMFGKLMILNRQAVLRDRIIDPQTPIRQCVKA